MEAPPKISAACTIFNAGSTAISFVSNKIISHHGFDVPLTFDNCSVLGPEDSCVITATIPIDHAHACKVEINESKTNVRGVLEVRRSNNTVVLFNSELR